jgi:hypothetical protein
MTVSKQDIIKVTIEFGSGEPLVVLSPQAGPSCVNAFQTDSVRRRDRTANPGQTTGFFGVKKVACRDAVEWGNPLCSWRCFLGAGHWI